MQRPSLHWKAKADVKYPGSFLEKISKADLCEAHSPIVQKGLHDRLSPSSLPVAGSPVYVVHPWVACLLGVLLPDESESDSLFTFLLLGVGIRGCTTF